MTRAELLSSREYWITKIQLDLYQELETYMREHNVSRTQLAEKLGVTKGYISQVLNGDFDHKISKLIELSLAMDKVPSITYSSLTKAIIDDERGDENPFKFKAVLKADQSHELSYSQNIDNCQEYVVFN